jgi:hypothetical protein
MPLATGCDTLCESTLTGRLWDEGRANHCLPAPKPNLKLYRAPDNEDVLVTYDELREKNDSIQRRAFFLKPNVRKLEERKRPKFVKASKVAELRWISVVEAGSTNAPVGEQVVVKVSADGQEFALISHGAELGPYVLPIYLDRGSQVRRAVLTPLATMGDVIVVVVIVGAVAGVVLLYGYAAGNGACCHP